MTASPLQPARAERGWQRRAVSALGGACLLMVYVLLALWVLAVVTTDRLVLVQYLYWANPLLVLVGGVMWVTGWALRRVGGVRKVGRVGVVVLGMCLVVMGGRELGVWRMVGNVFRAGPPKGGSLRIVHWNASVYDVRPGLDIGLALCEGGTPDVVFVSIQNNPRLWKQITSAMAGSEREAGSIVMLNTGDDKVFSRFPVRALAATRVSFSEAGVQGPRTVPPILRRTLGWLFRSLQLNQRSAEFIEDATVVAVEVDATARVGRKMTVWFIDMPSNPIAGRVDLARRVRERTDGLRATGQLPAPDLILGDFNIPMGSHSLGVIGPGFAEASSSAGLGRLASWPRGRAVLQIDHVLVGPGWRFDQYKVIDPGASEHLAQSLRVWKVGR